LMPTAENLTPPVLLTKDMTVIYSTVACRLLMTI
jgi:hypothetical protein